MCVRNEPHDADGTNDATPVQEPHAKPAKCAKLSTLLIGLLARRLFDADMPEGSIRSYLRLAALCPKPAEASEVELAEIDGFVRAHSLLGAPRNRETLRRMREALDGISSVRRKEKP